MPSARVTAIMSVMGVEGGTVAAAAVAAACITAASVTIALAVVAGVEGGDGAIADGSKSNARLEHVTVPRRRRTYYIRVSPSSCCVYLFAHQSERQQYLVDINLLPLKDDRDDHFKSRIDTRVQVASLGAHQWLTCVVSR